VVPIVVPTEVGVAGGGAGVAQVVSVLGTQLVIGMVTVPGVGTG
jgi:uncharacterized membrane protein YtjA (UPF0391 family)